jgi:energy-coupling factor transporter ATP-binding protein EcfA2
LDFYTIVTIEKKDGTLQIRPDWKVGRSEDLMTRGGSFYAVWDEERGLWSKDIYDVARLVDADLIRYAKEQEAKTGFVYRVARMEVNSTKLWDEFQRFLRNSGNNSHQLDETLIFANTQVSKTDFASRRLSYSLYDGNHDAWDALVGTLYNEEERAKIEWAIGAVVSGDSKLIQKFLVFYGPPGSGKSTVLNIIEKLFHGYTSVFDARELAGSNNAFATAAFKSNPLVAIQHDGDLSRIVDNTKLNSIVAHETMTVNEKYKAPFEARSHAFLFMGTNVPVRISDAKSGIIRRLIDVVPTQRTIDHDGYHLLMERIDFELGAIAKHCLDRYLLMGKNYYSGYRPTEMMLQTDVFYNYVEFYFDIFKADDGITLKKAWSLYKEFCAETGIEKILPQYKFREELKNYFYSFEERARIEGVNVRSYYHGFKHLQSMGPSTALPVKPEGLYTIEMQEGPSIFDELNPGLPAQYANEDGLPSKKWANVKTTLADIDTTQLHFVKVPENHIVVDFDLVDEDGEKDLELNLQEASKWPATYAELSKSGRGVHLHYIYTGDVNELASVYDVGIEIKTLLGDSSLRRKLTKSNHVNITFLDGGLPKKEKPTLSNKSVQSEKGLRELIARNLRKEIHPGTKPSVDFIHKILEEAYDSGMAYDLRDMRSDVLTFAAKSTNQADICIKRVLSMKFVGQKSMPEEKLEDAPLTFFDVEVYPNLFVVCWKHRGADTVVRMINPKSKDIESLFKLKLIGFNNRRYDNHILYAAYLGYSLEELHRLSQRIIYSENNRDVYFGEAYNISYTDIYDFSSKKQPLKRFMIDLDIRHIELDLPWDQDVPEELWDKVVEYCVNDVNGTEATFEARLQDFVARQILAELSGLSVNQTTQMHTAKIIFGEEKSPQGQFVYTDLSQMFPGYKFDGKESTYRGEITGEGGYVHAEPGIYSNVAVLDVASMHPTSIEQLNLFGPYTQRYSELKEARLAIKRKDYERCKTLLDGRLAPFVDGDDISAEALAYALKIVINIVYGLTSARFPNAFRDNRNKDNIVAKRGALFMIDLKHEVQSRGFSVVHIKTDSIKIPDATPEIIEFVTEFGHKYGYDFEHEVTYDTLCLVNDAVYVAKKDKKWTAVGAQFQHPYVFKTLFTHEPLVFADFCEMKNVIQGTMYLDFSGTEDIKQMVHVGKTGSFVPVTDRGGVLWRIKDDKKYAVTGTKGLLWINRDVATKRKEDGELNINMDYFEDLKNKAAAAITQFSDSDDINDFVY